MTVFSPFHDLIGRKTIYTLMGAKSAPRLTNAQSKASLPRLGSQSYYIPTFPLVLCLVPNKCVD